MCHKYNEWMREPFITFFYTWSHRVNYEVVWKKNVRDIILINEKGKLKHPAGLLVDDVGNILVADNGRGSLCIFRESGVFFEELRLKEIRRPSDIIRQGRTLLVACGSLPSPFLKVLRLLLLGPWTIHRIKESEYLLHSSLSDPRA